MTPDLKTVKYINDPVYGGIPITKLESELIDTPVFQRLRGLRQLARVNYVFPGAEHSRFVHSLGVLYIMELMTDHLLRSNKIEEIDAIKLRVAALLHDIGHYPFSHLGESAYGYCEDNNTVDSILQDSNITKNNAPLYILSSSHSKTAHHEFLGKYIVSHNETIKSILGNYGLEPLEISEIFTGEIGSRKMLYSQMLHSSLDADRLDYLLRDSYQTGVKYGLVDLNYLIRLLMVVDDKDLFNQKILACNKKGQHVVEHFLMSRYFHYSQVVFHKTNAAFEGMIKSMYIKLIANSELIFKSLSEIHKNINDDSFLSFNDSLLEESFKQFYSVTNDEEYKCLYEMYRDRIRPKVIFELKELYSDNPSRKFTVLKWILKNEPEKITDCIGTAKWGYQVIPITIEKIQSHYRLSERKEKYEEELRETIKVYDKDNDSITLLAEDPLSIISRLADFKNEFIRIYVLEEKGLDYNYKKMNAAICELLSNSL